MLFISHILFLISTYRTMCFSLFELFLFFHLDYNITNKSIYQVLSFWSCFYIFHLDYTITNKSTHYTISFTSFFLKSHIDELINPSHSALHIFFLKISYRWTNPSITFRLSDKNFILSYRLTNLSIMLSPS